MDPRWTAQIKAGRGINLGDLWMLLVMTFMNILWKVENVIINFYIRKWGRNIKQTALSIEHSPRVKRIVSGITGELTRKKGRNENQLLWRDGKDSSFYRTAFNKIQQNAPCTTSQGERGVNGDTIAQTAVYTQPQEETRDTWSYTSDDATLTMNTSTVLSMRSGIGSMFCIHSVLAVLKKHALF